MHTCTFNRYFVSTISFSMRLAIIIYVIATNKIRTAILNLLQFIKYNETILNNSNNGVFASF